MQSNNMFKENENPHVLILICTCNGEKFLEEQLISFEEQTYVNWAVIASDANRSFMCLDASGQPRLTVPYGKDLPAPFKYVVALCSDPLGHVAAIVDGGDFEGIVLWGPDGSVLRQGTFKGLGLSGKFRAIALDREGGVLLADKSNDVLIRLD